MSLLTNLIGYWKLDELGDSDNALDAHGSNTLTQANSPGNGTGIINGARVIIGGKYFALNDNPDLSTGDIDFTIQAWVRAPSFGGFYKPVMGRWYGGQQEYLLYWLSSSNRFYFSVSSNGSNQTDLVASNAGAPSTDTWYCIHAWHDSVTNKIGISVNAGTPNTANHTTGVYDGTSQFHIGLNGGDSDTPWGGLIDEVGFWKRVLTSEERTQLYNGGSGLSYDDFPGWRLIGSSGANSTDGNTVTPSAFDTTGADLLVGFVASASGITPVDSLGNTPIGLTGQVGNFSGKLRLWYVASPIVGPGHIWSGGAPGESPTIAWAALRGAHASPFDQQNGTSTPAENVQPGIITPSESDCLVVTAAGVYTTSFGGPNVTGAYTKIAGFQGFSSMAWGGSLALLIQATATATNPLWTGSPSEGNFVAVIASFKLSGGVVVEPPPEGQPIVKRFDRLPSQGGIGKVRHPWGRSPAGIIVPQRLGVESHGRSTRLS